MSATARQHSPVRGTPAEHEHLPEFVRSYLARSLPASGQVPATVRVQQTGEMLRRPGGRVMPFRATEDFSIDRVAFSWRARFAIVGPLAVTVVDEFADGVGRLRVSLFGIPLKTMKGPETDVGEAMRYLSELAWAPQAMAENRELVWREVDEGTVEVASVRGSTAVVELEFDAAGDIVRGDGDATVRGRQDLRSNVLGRRLQRLRELQRHPRPNLRASVAGATRGPLRLLARAHRRARTDRTGGIGAMAATFQNTRLRHLGNVLVTLLARVGLAGKRTHILTGPGRRSGRRYSTPVQLVIQDDERWLLAHYGEREWVKNARAASEVELTRAGKTICYAIEEIGPDKAAPVLREYLRTTPVVKGYFDATADAPLEAFAAAVSRHPVFRLAAAAS